MTGNGSRRRDPGPARPRHRASSDGPIHPNRDRYAADVSATTPAGAKPRGYVDGATRQSVDGKRLTLHARAAAAPIPTLAQHLTRWLADVVAPSLEPATYAYYETMARLYIIPALGAKRLDQLQTRDVQDWLTTLATVCQCCTQGKDAARPAGRHRCCAVGACCAEHAGRRTVQAARNTLRAALNHAMATGEVVARNVAAFAKVPSPPKHRRKGSVWNVAEASRFLASAREDDDPLYAAYVLILVNGLRKGEVLGLTWPSADLAGEELETGWQLQRVGRQLIHKRAGAGEPGAGHTVLLPGICAAALRLRRDEQEAAWQQAGGRWRESDLVFTTRWGTPVEPRNFNRSFDARCTKAGVTRIRVHDTRHTCASILAALDVHPQLVARILRHARITTTTVRLQRRPRQRDPPGAEETRRQPQRPAVRAPGPAMTTRLNRGGGLLAVASCLLLLLAAAQGYVSFRAQYVFINHAKQASLPSMLEALGLDTGAVIFALLGLSLARRGKAATVERILNVACALGSLTMNLLAADLGSPRSVTVWVMPSALYALASDRLIAVVRRWAQAADPQAQLAVDGSPWRAFGGLAFWLLRLTLDVPGTVTGFRRWVLAAAPVAPGVRAEANPQEAERLPRNVTARNQPRRLAEPHARDASTHVPAAAGETKRAALIRWYEYLGQTGDPRYGNRAKTAELAGEIATQIGYHPGTARRELAKHVASQRAAVQEPKTNTEYEAEAVA